MMTDSNSPAAAILSGNTIDACIVSSFTAEPIERSLVAQNKALGIDLNLRFAPTEQLNQQLLDPHSVLAKTKQGIHLLLLRFEDLAYYQGNAEAADQDSEVYFSQINDNCTELLANLAQFTAQSKLPMYLLLCPASKDAIAQYSETLFENLARSLAQTCSTVADVRLMLMSDFDNTSVEQYHDKVRSSLADIPYQAFYYDAIAACLTRQIAAAGHLPSKVIVLDADNTLWRGVCGEQPVAQLEISAGFRALQQFVLARKGEGMLLCLASKNHLDDAKRVFESHPQMLLKWDDLVATQVNWSAKSDNIMAMAQSLNLGLDGFIFIDDNPVECAEVRSRLPQVLTLALPEQDQDIELFLARLLQFCPQSTTKEDANRHLMYQQNQAREHYQSRFKSLTEFIENLQINIQLTEISAADLPRVAQMTARTNQFNIRKQARTLEQVTAFLAEPDKRGFIANVRDRFGEYGTTGLVLVKKVQRQLIVDTLLLSCRVLGRGVEHAMVANIGRIALDLDCYMVVFNFTRSEKNQPAENFLLSLNGRSQIVQPQQLEFQLSAEQMAATVFNPVSAQTQQNQEPVFSDPDSSSQINDSTVKSELTTMSANIIASSDNGQHQALILYLQDLFAEVCMVEASDLDPKRQYDGLGISSFFIIEITVKLESLFSQLPDGLLFSYLTIESLADYLTSNHAATVAALLQQQQTQVSDIEAVIETQSLSEAVEIDLEPELSIAQTAMLIMDQGAQAPLSHMIPLTITLRQAVDVAALDWSFSQVIERHHALRSQFYTSGEQFHCRLLGEVSFNTQVIDLTTVASKERNAEVERVSRLEVQTPFDLNQQLPIRATLLKIREGRSILLVNLHHMVSDGWSIRLLLAELAVFYQAKIQYNSAPDVKPIPRNYYQLADQQRQALHSGQFSDQYDYWRKILQGVPSLLDLPTDRPRPAEQSFDTEVLHFSLSSAVSDDLRSLSREFGCSMYATLLTAYGVVLGQYSGQQDLIIGSPIANRDAAGARDVIGYFANVVPQRLQLQQDLGFAELVAIVNQNAKAAFEQGNLPFSEIVKCAQLQRAANYSPLVQVLFALQNTPISSRDLLAGDFSLLGTARCQSLFDLTLEIDDTSEQIKGRFEYNLELFDRETIERLSCRLQLLLTAIVDDPDEIVTDYSLTVDGESALLHDWQNVAVKKPQYADLGQLFDGRLGEMADDTAFTYQDHTYAQLIAQINGLAQGLIAQGIDAQQPVGIYLSNPLDSAIAALAVSKVGGYWVEFDGRASALKVANLIELSGVSSLLCDDPEPLGCELKKLHLDEPLSQLRLMNIDEISLPNSDFAPTKLEPATLVGIVYCNDESGIDNAFAITASPLNGFLNTYLFSAEQPLALLSKIPIYAQSVTLHALVSLLKGATSEDSNPQSLASWPKECASSGIYLLDQQSKGVPWGAVGEVCVCVADKQLDLPQANHQRFIAAGIVANGSGVLYRSGEFARFDKQGRLQFVPSERRHGLFGNMASEVATIEAALAQKQWIERLLFSDTQTLNSHRLICYVVTKTPQGKDWSQQLQQFLRSQVDLTPLVSNFMLLDELPLDQYGQLDRAALPLPQTRTVIYVAPQTPTEQALVDIWQQRLGIESIGTKDNYFVLGGDSIRAIALIADAGKQGLDFAVKDLFAHPTIAELAAALDQDRVESAVLKPIEPFSMLSCQEQVLLQSKYPDGQLDDAYPLSLMQQGMVLLAIKQRHLNVYVNLHVYQFEDRYDDQLFNQALAYMLEKHTMLRSVYDRSGHRPLLLVHKQLHPTLNIIDKRDIANSQIQSCIDSWMADEQQQDLDTAKQLWRLSIILLPEDRFLFCMDIHHAQWDGWSLESFITELYDIYGSLRSGKALPSYEKLPTYNQFVRLEQQAIDNTQYRDYWVETLTGANLLWWTGQEKSGSVTVHRDLCIETSLALTELAAQLGVQEKSLWCAVYMVILNMLNGSDDVAGPVINQGRPEVPGGEKMLGVFLNALVLTVSMKNKTWTQFICDTDVQMREQHAYRRYPVAEMQRLTGLDFSAGVFTYTNWHVYYNEKNSASSIVPNKVDTWSETNYLLSLYVAKDEKSRRFKFSFDADVGVFNQSMRALIVDYAFNIIDGLLANCNDLIDKTALMGQSRRQQQLQQWNATEQQYDGQLCIQQLVEQQVAANPDATALVFEGDSLSYNEVNVQANQLAHYLRSAKIGPDVCVGICVERSFSMIIGLLAILKAGGAYVPLDPQYPDARLEYMAKQSGCKMVLTEQSLIEELPFLSSTKNLPMDSDIFDIMVSKQPIENIAPQSIGLCSQNLAYVIYTSGSTGEPKGVPICHQSLSNLALFQSRQYGLDSSSRMLQFAFLSFDAATWDWSMALCSGASLYLLPEETMKSIDRLGQFVKQHQISYSYLPPALLNYLKIEDFDSLKTITVGGEAPSMDVVLKWAKNRQLFNCYGPTENTVVATNHLVSEHDEHLYIGRPITNVKAYVLDTKGEIVTPGVVGELCLSGDGLSPGYIGKPALTAASFLPNPYSETGGGRLYRTGDLVCYNSEGVLEFKGRIDHQVKIRGFRIELGEIQNVIKRHAKVSEVVVIACEDGSGEKRLVAYVVAQQGAQPDSQHDEQESIQSLMDSNVLMAELKSHVQAQLPNYMVPSAFVLIDALPLTANGKLDRKQLPEADFSAQGYIPPEGHIEIRLGAIWCEVLKCDKVGRMDNFFEIGGHSLLATQVLFNINEQFGVELTIRTLFDCVTITEQAQAIEQAQQQQQRDKQLEQTRGSLAEFEGALDEGEL